ncbi:MAG: transglycosylase SLT domain-containing protein [Methylococcales bacterium]|nr:transglycosylase SLT domain-containing protein [Methylococcales bacterium]
MFDKSVANDAIVLLILILATHITLAKAETIPSNYHKIAIENNIPTVILYAVALAESATKIKPRHYKPWPWTLNVAGIPRRYSTRKSAYKGLIYFLQQGVKSIDIGIMQINWRYHHKKLGTPWQALEPIHNIQTGASILNGEYKITGEWKQAIGRYHSPGQKPKQKKRALNYANRVMKHIHRVTQ